MLVVTFIVLCVFAYWSLTMYKTETADTAFYNRNSFPPALGGWLIVAGSHTLYNPAGDHSPI